MKVLRRTDRLLAFDYGHIGTARHLLCKRAARIAVPAGEIGRFNLSEKGAEPK